VEARAPLRGGYRRPPRRRRRVINWRATEARQVSMTTSEGENARARQRSDNAANLGEMRVVYTATEGVWSGFIPSIGETERSVE